MANKQILVVGCGFSGATVARVLADHGFQVDIIDSRNHIGGNAYDYVNEHSINIHKYGAHIFHTSNDFVFDWLSNFTEWTEYQHCVVAMLDDGTTVTFPPKKSLVEQYGIEKIREIFYVPYTKKMWGTEVDKSVIDRVPIRDDESVLYFPKDRYQYLPKFGYTNLFKNLLDHKNIHVTLNTSFDKSMENDYIHVFNSMPIDVYYDYIHGTLPYRSIKFTHVNLPQPKVSNNTVINFTHDGPETRVIEWKNFPNHGTNNKITTLTYETPCCYTENNNERYYPVKDVEGSNRKIYNMYKIIPNPKVTFIGRCGMYVYIDMDQAVSSSINIAKNFLTQNAINCIM